MRKKRNPSWAHSARTLAFALAFAGSSSAQAEDWVREEARLDLPRGEWVFALRVRPPAPHRGVVVLTHGAGSPGSATWDLRAANHSTMEALARAGFEAYAFDARGFGGSSRPPALDGPEKGPPVVRAQDVLLEIDRVLRWAGEPAHFDLVGWSWGCVVAGLYASEHPDRVRSLALFAPVWARRNPERHITDRVWREESRALHESLRSGADHPAVHAEFVDALFRFSDDGVLRLPNGPYRDIYGVDAPIWDASAVSARTLVFRGMRDRASLRRQALDLYEGLSGARERRYVELGDTGHFAFRRRQAHRAFQEVLIGFLAGP
ncbi:MAG: alpha/beta fold hydrolase [Myxococcota bacterium]